MKHERISRGGAPVGHLGELGAVEAATVIYWRLWAGGLKGQRRAKTDFCTALGDKAGTQAVDALAQIFDTCARHGRRPLMRHGLGCTCVGADESCIANLIGYASECRRDDAALIATILVTPDLCMHMAALAQTFGLALRRMALAPRRKAEPTETHQSNRTVH